MTDWFYAAEPVFIIALGGFDPRYKSELATQLEMFLCLDINVGEYFKGIKLLLRWFFLEV